MTDVDTHYEFEKLDDTEREGTPRKHRDTDRATAERSKLLARLGFAQPANAPPLPDDLDDLLLKYATDYPLNIAWYTLKIRALRRIQRIWNGIAVFIGIFFVALIVLAAELLGEKSTVAANLGLFITAFLVTLQLLASVSDVKSQIGIFWETAADLKDALYSFEQAWRGKSWATDPAIRAEFRVALLDQLRSARVETRKERSQFFQTLKSPSDLVNSLLQAVSAVRGARTEVFTAQKAAADAQQTQQADLAKAVADARSADRKAATDVVLAEAKVQALAQLAAHGTTVDATETAAAAKELRDAQVRKAVAEAGLAAVVRQTAQSN